MSIARQKTKTWFTLIELLVVIAVIAILAAMLMPALESARTAALQSKCMSQQRQLHLGFQVYVMDHDSQLPTLRHKYIRRHTVYNNSYHDPYQPENVIFGPLGIIIKEGYVSPREMVECPDHRPAYPYQRLYDFPISDWQDPGAVDWPTSGQALSTYAVRTVGESWDRASLNKKVFLAPALAGDNLNPKDREWIHGEWPQNVPEDAWYPANAADIEATLPPVNVTLFDGSTHSLPDWGNVDKYPWHVNWGTRGDGGQGSFPYTSGNLDYVYGGAFYHTFDEHFE